MSKLQKPPHTDSVGSLENNFFPRGAFAFFGLLILIFAAIWSLCYAIMLAQR